MSATLHGRAQSDSNANNLGVNVIARFFEPGTDTEQHKAAAPTDSNGYFTMYGIPPGTYDVGLKSDHTLSILVANQTFVDNETTDIDFSWLEEGDLNGDDHIESADEAIFSYYYGNLGDCRGYAGDWLMPPCPTPPPAGASYGYIVG